MPRSRNIHNSSSSGGYCDVLAWEVKNVFNSAKFCGILCNGFADDLAFVVSTKESEDVKVYATERRNLTRESPVDLGREKPQAIVITNGRKKNIVRVEMSGHTIVLKLAITPGGDD